MSEPLPNPVVPDAPEEAPVSAPPRAEEQAPIRVLPRDPYAPRPRPPKTAPVSRDHPYVIKADPNGPFPECFAVLGRHQWVKYRLPRTPWLGSRTGHLYRFVYNKITKDRKKILWLHRLVAHCPKNRFVSFKNRDERDLRPNNLRIVTVKPKPRLPK